MRQTSGIATSLALILVAAPAGLASDWLQWRGPELNGSADDEKNLPVSFSRTENLAWAAPLPGPAGSTPIVVGDRIFLTSRNRRGTSLLAMCLSATDGAVLWSKILSKGKPGPGEAIVSCSPASDGKTVFFLFGPGDLAAVGLDGRLLWTRRLAVDYGPFALRPGGSGAIAHDAFAWQWTGPAPDVWTPLLYRGSLYVLSGDMRGKFMTCLDPKTGKVKWSSKFAATGFWRASPTGADGKISCLSEGGDYVVLAAGDKFEELFRCSLKSAQCRSTVVVANGSILIRTASELLCVRKTK